MSNFRDRSLFVPEPEPRRGFWSDFKRRFTRGLAALLPTLLTIAVLLWAYDLVNRAIGKPINRGFITLLSASGTPGEKGSVWEFLRIDEAEDAIKYGTQTDVVDDLGRRKTIESIALEKRAPSASSPNYETYLDQRRAILWRIAFNKYWLSLVGFGIAIVICYFIGLMLASFIGRTLWGYFESLFRRLPIVKAIYPHIKQVTDFLFDEKMLNFGGVMAVEYPRKGMWSIGLQTGDPMRTIAGQTDHPLVCVFICSSPTPFTGYVIQVPRSDTIDLPISIDEALRFIVSGGVIKPSGERLPGSVQAYVPEGEAPEPTPVSATPEKAS